MKFLFRMFSVFRGCSPLNGRERLPPNPGVRTSMGPAVPPSLAIERLLPIVIWIVTAFFISEGVFPHAGANTPPKTAPAPDFSVQHGFFTDPFQLTIRTAIAAASVRFTTDGASPSETNGFDYSGPISIAKTTVFRARVIQPGFLPSSIVTRTFIFLDDVIRQSPNGSAPEGWPSAWGENLVDYGMDPEVVHDPQYRNTIVDDLKTLPSFSIVMDLKDLFDSKTGIYSNAMEDGREAERPCSVELIFPDGREGFQIDAGIRIRGGFSRIASNPKHTFRLFFRGLYGETKLRYPLFGENGADSYDSIDLRTFQNYSWSFLGDSKGVFVRDQSARDAQLAMGQPAKRGQFYHLYLNGQYWGLYNTDERSEASYAESYFGGNKGDYDVIKVEPFIYRIEATDGDLDAWTRLYDMIRSGVQSDSAYQRIQGNNPDGSRNPAYEALLDADNLIDYMLLVFYGGNLDAPVSWFLNNNRPNNYYAIRDRTGGAGFRYFAHDSEHTLLNPFEDRTGPYLAGETSVAQSNPQWMFQKLQSNAEFRLRVADHVRRHFFNGGTLTPNAAAARFERRIHEIDRAVVGESARWGDAKRSKPFTRDVEWIAEVNNIRENFFPRRTQIVLEQLRRQGLYPNIEAPSFSKHGGIVEAEFNLIMTSQAGVLYYTIDGIDPRLLGGKVSPAARLYESPVVINESVRVTARVRHNGIWSALNEALFTIQQDFSGLAVIEIMYHPKAEAGVDGDEYEFLELQNLGSNELDLTGVHFTDGIRYRFPDGTRIFPGERITLVSNSTRFSEKHPNVRVDGVYSGKLSNAGETVTIADAAGKEVHSVAYSDKPPWPTEADGDGYSLEKNPFGIVENSSDPANWRASIAIGGSPGDGQQLDHAVFDGPIVINEIHYRPGAGGIEFIEIKNTSNKPVDLSNPIDTSESWKLEGVDFKFPPGQPIPAFGLAVVAASEPAAFRARYRVPGSIPVFGPYFGELGNRGERIRVLRPDRENLAVPSTPVFQVVEEVRYRSVAPWPIVRAGMDESIERIDANSPGAEPENWSVSPGDPSPGFENSRNRAPLVNAGSDLDIETQAFPFQLRLEGWARDDDLPLRSKKLLVLWTKASGPDGIRFRPGNSASTDVSFLTAGSYDLRLVAFDGARIAYDDATVTIREANSAQISDFDFDGKSDLLFQHTDGSLAMWFVEGPNLKASTLLNPAGSGAPEWRVAGIGDFDRDGKGDLLFQHAGGALSVWIMDGPNLRISGVVSPTSPDDPNWRVEALADFDGDLQPDFLFQHSNGGLVVWLMDGVIFTANKFPEPNHPGDAAWRVISAQDFNGDGKPDILLQHTDGTLAVWMMDGLKLTRVAFLNPNKPESALWRIVSASDFDGDGDPDLVFQNSNDGELAMWILDGLTLEQSSLLLPSQPGNGWKIVGP